MLEAIKRMEAGEDPDKIDEEMGDALDPMATHFHLNPRKGKSSRGILTP